MSGFTQSGLNWELPVFFRPMRDLSRKVNSYPAINRLGYFLSSPVGTWALSDRTSAEQAARLAVAGEAARRVNVPFLVVDIAQTEDKGWIVIECNDGQESGYAGVSPIGLWQKIIDLESGTVD